MECKFNTPFKRKYTRGEVNNSKYIIEIGTYQSSEKLIKSFINAGQIVAGSRRVVYDFPDGKDNGMKYPETRRRDYDLADASTSLNEIEARMSERQSEKLDTKQVSSEVPEKDTEKKEVPTSSTPEKTE